MIVWLEALLVAVSVCALIIIILYMLIRHRLASKHQAIVADHGLVSTTTAREPKTESFQRPSYHVFRQSLSTKPFFNWADHPTLITDAVENGWSRFAFTNYAPSSSVRSSLFGSLRVTGDYNINSNQVEMSWEVGQGSVDFMQKIRINGSNGATAAATSTIRMALPLPGPPCSFPQEAYFEITVLCSCDDHDGKSTVRIKGGEGEKTKLIHQNLSSSSPSPSNGKSENSEHLMHVTSSSKGAHVLEEVKNGGIRRGGEVAKMCLGFAGSSTTSKIPGSYPGSIGFNSNGSVFLGGMKLVFESEEEDWAQEGKVIGCGFDPRIRKVFFTVDSKLVREIHCKSEDFGMPLYPVLMANTDITILVNLGQSQFSYSPANAQRTPNPCFSGNIVNSSARALGYEDSRELFSMGRIDAEWLGHNVMIKSSISNSSNCNISKNSSKTMECDEESEADLFEIVLDRTRSPVIV